LEGQYTDGYSWTIKEQNENPEECRQGVERS
jgi:hypothetical protein